MSSSRPVLVAALLLLPVPLGVALIANGPPAPRSTDWRALAVPGCWEDTSKGELRDLDGFAWYRCFVQVPMAWNAADLTLQVEHVDNAHEAFVNGKKVGGRGGMPPHYRDATNEVGRYVVAANLLRPGGYNTIAIRVYDAGGRGGFKGAAPALVHGEAALVLAGNWQFRAGDDAAFAQPPPETPASARFEKVSDLPVPAAAPRPPVNGPLSPAAALATMRVPADLVVEQVLAEPTVRQPVSVSFDERGRMWVVQYLQYPVPAGLKIVSRDPFWRVVYDKVPAAPPHHVRGADRITIHEDTDGDGNFDRHTTFLDGLNVTTAVARGRGGVFVLNPPYFLFYPVKPGADVPSGDPEVLLEGFGLEDTHAVVNSLCWGPDGWLYAAQGSTVTGNVRRPLSKDPPVHTVGQLIWRYHPETRRYEVFAEGGGNAFGVEFDARGRLYSGHNGGNTRGFHYVQGGYYRKGFDKHGPLSNPYTFGFFEAMRHNAANRFSHTFAIDEAPGLPAHYRGHLFAADPLAGQIIEAAFTPEGSTRRTQDLAVVLKSSDRWFRPVDVKFGPGGALYVADWYDGQVNHYRNHEGKMDHDTGRIYRVRGRGTEPLRPFDLGKQTTAELVATLRSEDRWVRQTAQRLLGDRRDPAAIPLVGTLLAKEKGQIALEALWALNLSGGLTDAAALAALGHPEPAVREWTVRLLGDAEKVSPGLGQRLVELAGGEADVDVRSQLACSARRLPARQALPIINSLLRRDPDADDPHLPLLLWWAVEAKCGSDRDAVLALFDGPVLWQSRLVRDTVAPRLMRRLAAVGGAEELQACTRLFHAAPDAAAGKKLLEGFEAAFQGRGIAGLPAELIEALTKLGGGSLAFGVRLDRGGAVEAALALVTNAKAKLKDRLDCVEAFGEVNQPRCVPELLTLATGPEPNALRTAALTALQRYDDPRVAPAVLKALPKLPDRVRPAALALLVSRQGWALQLIEAVAAGNIDRAAIPADVVRRLAGIRNPKVVAAVRGVWGEVKGATTAEMQAEIDRVGKVLRSGVGSPTAGKTLFTARCASCHQLFGEGGGVGPDLTPYKRDDLSTLLLSVVNPSAEIREGFENHVIETTSGRTIVGILLEKDLKKLALRTGEGQRVVLDRDQIETESVSGVSLMPEGLLNGLSEQQLRDLFGYLRSTQPIPGGVR